ANFDIYLLDPSQPTGWATMSALGQSEFAPLYGYFIQNKTGTNQTLTLHYAEDLPAGQRLFDRTFSTPGWYSIGIANSAYATKANAGYSDTDNPSNVLSLLDGKYDLFVDFTNASYDTN